MPSMRSNCPQDDFLAFINGRKFSTVLADPPWQFQNRTGKMAPEHRRLSRYPTLSLGQIMDIPVEAAVTEPAHLYLWVPNALLAEGLEVMARWGFTYKTNLVWYKVRKDGGPDRRAFIFETSPSSSCSGSGEKTPGLCHRVAARKTSSPAGNGNIAGSPTNNTTSSRPAARGLTWKCLPEATGPGGSAGAIKPRTIHRTGRPMPTIRKPGLRLYNHNLTPCPVPIEVGPVS